MEKQTPRSAGGGNKFLKTQTRNFQDDFLLQKCYTLVALTGHQFAIELPGNRLITLPVLFAIDLCESSFKRRVKEKERNEERRGEEVTGKVEIIKVRKVWTEASKQVSQVSRYLTLLHSSTKDITYFLTGDAFHVLELIKPRLKGVYSK